MGLQRRGLLFWGAFCSCSWIADPAEPWGDKKLLFMVISGSFS
jgi:hypothetical protein